MTETTPDPGKTRITMEIDTADWDSGNFDLKESILDGDADIVHGPTEDPSDKCNRLLGEAEVEFRIGSSAYPFGDPSTTGQHLAKGAELLAQALKVFREEL